MKIIIIEHPKCGRFWLFIKYPSKLSNKYIGEK